MLYVLPLLSEQARQAVRQKHYLHRAPAISYSFGLATGELFGRLVGVITFGIPASHNIMVSACKSSPASVIELNRLWVSDECERNTESWFISRALKLLPPYIVVSYADTAWGHNGYVYRASNFAYAGVTDMDRKTPRCDAVTPGYHSRETSRNGTAATAEKVRRSVKHRYWTVTGNRRDQRRLRTLCTWPSLDWGQFDVIRANDITALPSS